MAVLPEHESDNPVDVGNLTLRIYGGREGQILVTGKFLYIFHLILCAKKNVKESDSVE